MFYLNYDIQKKLHFQYNKKYNFPNDHNTNIKKKNSIFHFNLCKFQFRKRINLIIIRIKKRTNHNTLFCFSSCLTYPSASVRFFSVLSQFVLVYLPETCNDLILSRIASSSSSEANRLSEPAKQEA